MMVAVVFVVILFHLEHKTIFMSLSQCFLQSLPISRCAFVLRCKTFVASCFVCLFHFAIGTTAAKNKGNRNHYHCSSVRTVPFVYIVPVHKRTEGSWRACFVFDNVISFLLVVCKHFISLNSGIFSLVPQLPIAIYVYLLIVSNSICNIYVFHLVYMYSLSFCFSCTHKHTHTHFWSKPAYTDAMQCHIRLTVPFSLFRTTFDKQSTLIANTFHIEQK